MFQTAKPFDYYHMYRKPIHISSTTKQIKAPKKPLGKTQGGGKYWPLQYCLSSSSSDLPVPFQRNRTYLFCTVQAPAKDGPTPSSPAPTKG
jgi:hypothetical protein